MARLTIEIPDKMHQHIKAMAAFEGMNMKQFVMERLTAPRSHKKSAKQKTPNARLRRSIKEADDLTKGIHYDNFDEWLKARDY